MRLRGLGERKNYLGYSPGEAVTRTAMLPRYDCNTKILATQRHNSVTDLRTHGTNNSAGPIYSVEQALSAIVALRQHLLGLMELGEIEYLTLVQHSGENTHDKPNNDTENGRRDDQIWI